MIKEQRVKVNVGLQNSIKWKKSYKSNRSLEHHHKQLFQKFPAIRPYIA